MGQPQRRKCLIVDVSEESANRWQRCIAMVGYLVTAHSPGFGVVSEKQTHKNFRGHKMAQ